MVLIRNLVSSQNYATSVGKGQLGVTVGTSQTPDAGCRAVEVLERVGDKWSMSVIYRLGGGSVRFNDLRRGIEGISQRMLTVTLRGLERDGLVSRTAHPVIALRVDYALTPMGRTLLETVCSLMQWAGEHRADIDAARAAYDARLAHAMLTDTGCPRVGEPERSAAGQE